MDIRILVKSVGGPLEAATIDNDNLAHMQGIVGGFIERYRIAQDVDVICNEEGKLQGLPLNFAIVVDGKVRDSFNGTVFFVSHNENGDFESLSDGQENYVRNYLAAALERTPV